MLEMFRRDQFRQDLLVERCDELTALDERLQELDTLLAASVSVRRAAPAARCACGAPLMGSSHFCANCGRPVAATPPVVGCAQCGSALAADAKFCAVCGHAVTAEQRARAVPDSTPLREPERHPEEAKSAENSVMIARTHRGVTSASWIFP